MRAKELKKKSAVETWDYGMTHFCCSLITVNCRHLSLFSYDSTTMSALTVHKIDSI